MSNGEVAKIKKIDLFSTPIRISSHEGYKYIIPKLLMQLQKPTANSKIFTITLYKILPQRTKRTLNFRFYTGNPSDPSLHTLSGFADVVGSFSNTFQSNAEAVCVGCIRNYRRINHGGESYMAVDIVVNQYGAATLMLEGIHSDISEIKDVTDNFSEVI